MWTPGNMDSRLMWTKPGFEIRKIEPRATSSKSGQNRLEQMAPYQESIECTYILLWWRSKVLSHSNLVNLFLEICVGNTIEMAERE